MAEEIKTDNTLVQGQPIETSQQQESELVGSYVYQAIEDNKREIENNQKAIEMMNTTDIDVFDYSADYNARIHNTGTALDGKQIMDVANENNTTPKNIFDTMDVVTSIPEGVRAAFASIYQMGGEISSYIFEPWIQLAEKAAGVESKPLTNEDKEKLMIFGKPEVTGRTSYAGDIIGGITEFATGASVTKPIKALKAAKLIKGKAGEKIISGLIDVVRAGVAEGMAFTGDQTNLNEFISSTFGVTPIEFLKKDDNDPELLKRLKNVMDGQVAAGVLSTTFKIAKKAFKPKSVVQKLIETADKVENTLPNGTKEAGEVAAKTTEEALVNRVKMFSDKELRKVLEEAENKSVIPKGTAKSANREVLENVAVKLTQQKRVIQSSADEASDALFKLSNGEMNQKEFNKKIVNLVKKTTDNTIGVKESLSGAGQIEAVASGSKEYKFMNKAISYIVENQDRIDTKRLAEMLSMAKDPEKAAAFFDTLEGIVKKGRLEDFVDKGVFVMQDFMLASGSSRLVDAASTFGHLMLQTAETAVTGAIVTPARIGVMGATNALRKIAGKKALETFRSEADKVLMSEALDMVHGVFRLLGETTMYSARKIRSKALNLAYNEENPFAKAIRQSVDASQTRMGLKREQAISVFSNNTQLGQTINKILNHGGVWAAEKIDDINQAIAYRAHLERNIGIMSRVKAAEEGWTRQQTKEFARDALLKAEKMEVNPNTIYNFADAMTTDGQIMRTIKRSAEEASVTTFRAPLESGSWEAGLYKYVNETPIIKQAMRLALPFQKTGLKIGAEEYMRKRSGVFSGRYLYQKAKQGGRELDEAIGRLTTGIGLQAGIWYMMKEGKITGPSPQNPGERALLKSSGWMPMSYKTDNGDYISLRNVAGPVSNMITGITTIVDKIDRINERVDEKSEEEWTDYLMMMPSFFAQAGVAETALGQWLEDVEKGDVTGFGAFTKTVSTLGVPLVQELKDWDAFQQTTLNGLDAFAKKWGIDTSVDELDLFGEPMYAKRRTPVAYGHVSLGQKVSKGTENDVVNTMLHYEAFVNPPSKNVTKNKRSIQLSPEEVYEWKQIMGENNTFVQMQDFIDSLEFQRLPEEKENIWGVANLNKTGALKKKYNQLKDAAFEELVRRNINVKTKLENAGIANQEPQVSKRYNQNVPTLQIK